MKVIAYTALHYGRDYLGYAIKSVIDHIDEYWVLYSPVGSHGFRTDVPCPDTRDELYNIARAVAGDKLHWIDGEWALEGQQRDAIYELCPDADVIITLDADEIWHPKLIKQCVGIVTDAEVGPWTNPQNIAVWRIPIIHYWRSFHRCVLHDPAFPERIVNRRAKGVAEINLRDFTFTPYDLVINHMGYAQRSEIVNYKQMTHGHRSEWRKDVNWFRDRFLANAQKDCHPVGSEFWNPEPVNPWDFMPDFMRQHPYAELEVIP